MIMRINEVNWSVRREDLSSKPKILDLCLLKIFFSLYKFGDYKIHAHTIHIYSKKIVCNYIFYLRKIVILGFGLNYRRLPRKNVIYTLLKDKILLIGRHVNNHRVTTGYRAFHL